MTKEVYGDQLKHSIIGDRYEVVDVVDALDWRQPESDSSDDENEGNNEVSVSETDPSMDTSNRRLPLELSNKSIV